MNPLTLALIIFMLILLILAFRLYIYLLRRATRKVINIFRFFDATSPEKALPLEVMGLRSTVPFISFRILKDYKPYVIQTLYRIGVIRDSLNNSFYLSEETLRTANLAI
jgi:hypothetical protein